MRQITRKMEDALKEMVCSLFPLSPYFVISSLVRLLKRTVTFRSVRLSMIPLETVEDIIKIRIEL